MEALSDSTVIRLWRMVNASSLLHEDEDGKDFSELFDKKGHWQEDEQTAR